MKKYAFCFVSPVRPGFFWVVAATLREALEIARDQCGGADVEYCGWRPRHDPQ
jgi:hypothetical protein